ncbi:Ig-like domain-containing protein [Brevibacillus fulvus]|uniref:Uncharacterized protein YjdB n=1 Tax=Brevibacillus fulvus TaxID=1125967 RepID=A0A938Y540_9BACL|nr:Ig-like domain-containing protein [Brevibacillus fulvus]MBM7591747.1 uncharacterized protein YjdB [Brevibacillus fulvus]
MVKTKWKQYLAVTVTVGLLTLGAQSTPASAAQSVSAEQLTQGQAVAQTAAFSTTSTKKLKANHSSVSLKKGKSKTISLTYDGKKISGSKAKWTTSKSSVATVSKSGKIKAKKKGTATITAKYQSKTVKIKVTVN